MRRLLTASAVAVGLFIPVVSCGPDRAVAPKFGRVEAIAKAQLATNVVISQVYGGGGNTGAPAALYKNDFIELFNPTTAAISVAGWSVGYASATGNTWQLTNLTGSIPPGGYYLVQEAAGTSTTSIPLPTPNASGGINMSGTTGKVFLFSSTAAPGSIACPAANVVDKVSYGSVVSNPTDCGFGRTNVDLNNNSAAIRNNGGCEWTPALASDFQKITPPTPRNSASPPNSGCIQQVLGNVVFQTPTPNTVALGSTVTLSAIAQDLSGNPINASLVQWTWSTDNSGISVGAAPNGTSLDISVSGLTVGQTILSVTANYNGRQAIVQQTITVTNPVVASVTVSPATATILNGNTQQFSAAAFDAAHNPLSGTTFTWSSSDNTGAPVDAHGLVTAHVAGDYTITATAPNNVAGTATLHIDPIVPPPTVRFSELHYDNTGTDQGEAIEIEGPAGTDLAGWSIALYNGNAADANFPLQVYTTTPLTGVIAARAACNGRGVLTFTYPVNGIQNGNSGGDGTSPDGMALVDASNHVVEFLSYEGTFTAANGPAAGMTSKSIVVMEDNPVPAVGRSLQRSADGTTWSGPSLASFDRCNLEGPPPPENGITFSGRLTTDPALPVGFEDQLFATLHDAVTNAVIPATFTWTALTPAIATIDAKGVMHALSAGTAQFKATADDAPHSSATYSLVMSDPQPVPGIFSGNTEFGTPIGANDVVVTHDQFTASFSLSRNIPNWVSAKIDPSHLGSGVDRCDCFTYDPAVVTAQPSVARPYTTGDYTGAGSFAKYGIDRGHLLRSGDVTVSDGDNKFSYLFTNIVPQSAGMNQQGGPWFAEEVDLGNLVRTGGKDVWIIAGAFGSKGTVKDEGLITIPAYMYKIAVVMPHGQHLSDVHSPSDIQVIARIYPNDPFTYTDGPANGRPVLPSGDWNYSGYVATVDQVEALSGYDFLDLLPDQIEIAVESNTSAPVARTNGPFSATEGSPVSMSAATSSDADGDALTYTWNFGDGTTGTGVSPSHTYARYGDFTVTVTATDIRGLINTATTSAHVDNVAPTLSSVAGGTIQVGNTFSSSGTFSDPGSGDPLNATVNYGDGSGVQALALSGNSFSLSHTYASYGSFTVTVTLSDGIATASTSAAVTVQSPPVAKAGGPYASSEGSALTLSGAGSSDADGTIATYAWSFSDGGSASGPSVSHTFAQDGSYTVQLTVTDNDGLSNTTTTNVTVVNVPPSIGAIAGGTILVGGTFTSSGSFTDPGSDVCTATVDYGDGTGVQPLALSGNSFTLSHVYATHGTRTVTVSISDDHTTSTQTATVIVHALPTANAGGPYASSEGSSVAFDGSASHDVDGTVTTYAWNFGDGATASDASPSHTYTNDGTYTVTLTVTDNDNLSSTATTSVTVANVAPSVSAITGSTILVGEMFAGAGSFTDPGSDTWSATVNYGDGTGDQPLVLAGKSFTLSHTYATHGAFTVLVTISDGAATGTSSASVVVHAKPVANTGGPYTSNEGSSVTLNGAGSTDPDGAVTTYAWNFGDGATGSGASPSHTYANDGNYTVSLTVTDNDGLTNTATTSVAVGNVAPSVAVFGGATILPHETYTASGSFADPGSDTWSATVNYGDGSGTHALALSGKNFSLSHTYAAPGSYTVTVSVNDGAANGGNTATVVVKTFVQGAQDIAPLLNGINSLNAKLDAAIKSLDKGNTTPALNQLNALLNEVDAMVRSRRMESADANAIRAAVNRLTASISG